MQWLQIMWPELSQQLSKVTQVSLQTWRQLHNKGIFGCSSPASAFALLQNACFYCLSHTWVREEGELHKYLVSRDVQSCIGYFTLSESFFHIHLITHALCTLLPFWLFGARYFFPAPCQIQLTRIPLLQGKNKTSLNDNFFSTSIAGITKLLSS